MLMEVVDTCNISCGSSGHDPNGLPGFPSEPPKDWCPEIVKLLY
jgi:hypothetical protein